MNAATATWASGDPAVRLDQGTLTVERWATSESEVIRLFERREADGDLSTLFDRVVETGARALSAADSSMDVYMVDREFSRLAARLEQVLGEQLGSVAQLLDRIFSDESGVLREALDRYLGEGGSLADMFDPDRRSSAVGRLNQILESHFGGRGSKLYQLLDHNDPMSPIRAWHEELTVRFDELRRQLEDYRKETAVSAATTLATAAEREKGSLKGRDFEGIVYEVLDPIARGFGDTVEIMADTAGLGGSKVGDFIITINPRDTAGEPLRIALEAKDRELGLTPMLRELDEAIRNRDACAAIGIYSRDDLAPRGTAPFREHGHRYLCVLDKAAPDNTAAIELAYRAARYWSILQNAVSDGTLDTDAIAKDLAAATARLKSFSDLKRQVTKLHRTMDEGTSGLARSLDVLHADLREIFDRLDQRLRAA